MKRNYKVLAPAIFLVLSLIAMGCGNSGAFIASTSTEVQLQEGNFSIRAVNITGMAETAYLLGGSYSLGMTTQSFGIIPLKGAKTLYKKALENLWKAFKEQNNTVEGRKMALVNVQYDAATVNYILYTKATVTITADIVEFE